MPDKQYVHEYQRQEDVYQIGNRLYAARKAKKWTQFELCIASGVPYKTISAIENGRQMPNFSTMTALARALKCPISAFQPEDLDSYTNYSPDVWLVAEKLSKENPPERQKICEFILRLLAK